MSVVSRAIVRRPLIAAAANWERDLAAPLARVYRARGITEAEQVDYSLQRLARPAGLRNMQAAATLLANALQCNARLLVVGDYDADGATGTALAVLGLRALGASQVNYLVPNRFEYGYGLTPEIVAVALRESPPALIITVDNGISSVDGVRAARQAGVAVLITDHHLPGAELPSADVIVNPNQASDTFVSKALAGVGVMFYVLLALRARLRETGWFNADRPEPNLADYLDLVALGTVADLVPLDHNNRILAAQGLARINAGRTRPGLAALLQAGHRTPGRITTSDLAFVVAPRLNAAGRLENMSTGIECLLADDIERAARLATELNEINQARKVIQEQMQSQALDYLADLASEPQLGYCLHDSGWHQGVVGLIAARLRERTGRPVVAFAPASDTELKGSARSIPGLHIRDLFEAIATRHPGLVLKYGGHAMAAGLSIRTIDLQHFQGAYAAELARTLRAEDLGDVLWSDGELAAAEFTLDTAETLRNASPWGKDFPEPVFDGVFQVVAARAVKDRHLKLRLSATTGGPILDGICFGYLDDHERPSAASSLRLAYRLEVNEFRGARALQLIIEQIEKC